jgi:dihydrodipicolinate synthase/N-acetylneuraminate lyase
MNRSQLLERLRGAYVALATPFTTEDSVDDRALSSNIRWLSTTGLSGFLLLGSTGEQPHLSEFERTLVLEVGRQAIRDDLVLIAGTGLAGTRLTIDETRRAADTGADIALVVTPSYYQKSMTAAALTRHYQAVADASPIPVLLYSVPPITNVTIPPETVAALAAHPNVLGMKNSGHDAQVAAAYRAAAGEHEFILLGGSAYAAPGFLLAGLVDGVILAAANVVPEAAAGLVQAAVARDVAAVRQQGDLLYHCSDSVGKFGIAGWKAGLAARGQAGGAARSPQRTLTGDEAQQVRVWVEKNVPA